MNNIDTSQIVDPAIQQPFTGRSLTFLQNATKESMRGICEGMMGDTLAGASASVGVAVSGCTFSASGDTCFTGFIYYNGELFYFPGISGLNSFAFTPYFDYDITNDGTADPLTFSDGNNRNVHKVRRLKVVDSAFALLFPLSSLNNINSKWFTVGATGSPAFSSGSYSTGGAGQAVKFRKFHNQVTIVGRLTVSNGAPSTRIFTLPAGFIPGIGSTPDKIMGYACVNDTTAALKLNNVYVNTSNGDVCLFEMNGGGVVSNGGTGAEYYFFIQYQL